MPLIMWLGGKTRLDTFNFKGNNDVAENIQKGLDFVLQKHLEDKGVTIDASIVVSRQFLKGRKEARWPVKHLANEKIRLDWDFHSAQDMGVQVI